jgi:Fic family protein
MTLNFEEANEIRWSELNALERIVVGFARTASLTSSMRISSKGVVATTTEDLVLKALQDNEAFNTDKGLSSSELAKKVEDRSLNSIQKALPELINKGLVKRYQIGRRIKYYTESRPE